MAEGMVVGRGLVEILPDFRKWGKQLAADMKLASRQLDGSAQGFKKSAATIGASMAKVGKGASLVGVGVGVAAVKMAGDFQAETAVLQTAAGETTKGLAVVRKGILSISENTGTGIKNLTDGMYLIEKAGFRGSEGLKVLRAAAQGAREENAKLSDVTNAMTSIMASYHLKADQSVMVMNAMKTAAGEGKINMEEFSGALSTVLPIASANKISFDQVAGAMATLTQHGTSAREATHELGATIRALASPNMVAQREMARFGLSSVDVSTKLGQRGLTGTIDLLTTTILHKMGPGGKILLSAFEGTKQSAEDARIMISKMPPEVQKSAKAFLAGKIEADDWNATVKGSGVAVSPMLRNFTTLVNRSKGFSRELKSGGPAAKTYTDALKKMSGGAIGLNTILQLSGESFDGFKERVHKVGESLHHNTKDVEGWKVTQKLLNVQLDMAKQRFQVLLITIGTKLIPVVTRIVKLFTEHKNVTLGLVVGMISLIGILSAAYVATKVWAVATGIATAAMFAFNVVTMRETESMAVLRTQMLLLSIQERAVAVWTAITSAAFWGLAAAILANPITWIVVGIAALIAGIVLLATKTRFFQKLWGAVWGAIKAATLGFVHWLKSNWQLVVWTILTGGIGLAVAMIVRHWEGVKTGFNAVINFIKKHWTEMLAALGGPLGIAILMIVRHWHGIADGAKKAFDATINFAVSFGKGFVGFFVKLPGQIGHVFSVLPGIIGHWFVVAGSAVGDFFKKLPGRIASFAVGFGKALVGAGRDLIMGLFHGASDFFTKTVPEWAKSVWHGIVGFFKAVFGIHSPSTVMAALGVDLMRGLFVGMLRIAATAGAWLGTHVYRPVINFFRNVGSWLVSQGRNLLLGWIRGELAVANTINSWLSSHVYRPVINFFSNAGRWLYTHGRNTILGLFNGFKAIWGSVSTWVSGRRAAITGALGAVGRLLYQKGRDVLNGLLSGLKSVWHDLTSWVSGIAKWIKDHKGPISLDSRLLTPAGKALMKGLLKGLKIGFKDVGEFIYGTGDSVADVIGKLKKLFSAGLGKIGLGKSGPVSRFRDLIALALRLLHQPIGYMGLVERRMAQESGGNPNIVNKWDSNWKAGHPSVGLMQVIRGTFQRYAGPYRNKGPFLYGVSVDPMANIYAGLNYALHRYGSLGALGRPGGYDSGGIASGMGFLAKFTNKPERVLSPQQTEAFERLVDKLPSARGGGGGTTVVNASFHNHGIIGSQHEMENWLVNSFDQLQRKGRIRVVTRTGS